MAKKSKKEKERLSASSDSNATIPGAPNYKPYQALAPAKGEHTNPKVTPQAPKGAALSPQPKPLLPQLPPSHKVTKPEPGTSGSSFHIPKGATKGEGTLHKALKLTASFLHQLSNHQLSNHEPMHQLPKVANSTGFRTINGHCYSLRSTKTRFTTSPSHTRTSVWLEK
jgi:hypothetical protein